MTAISKGVRDVLLSAPPSGVVTVPYSTGSALKRRGYGDEIADRSGDRGTGFPMITLRLNEDGLNAAHQLREEQVYEATFESVTGELGEILRDRELGQVLAEACVLVERLETSGQSSAGARAYRDALVAHAQAVTP